MNKGTKLLELSDGTTFPVPKGFNRKNLEFLMLVFPEPIGLGLKIKDAVKLLGTTPSSGYDMMARIKKDFPKVYEQYKSALRTKTRQVRHKRMKSLGFRKDGTDMLTWLEEQSASGCPSQEARDFGLIREVF